jgi:hypothetical protein
MGLISLVFDATSELLVIYFCFCQILDKNGNKIKQCIYTTFVKYLIKKWEYIEVVLQQFIDCKKAYGSVRKVFLYNILIELLSL